MPKQHSIEIKVNGNEAMPPDPLPDMEEGDTVKYSSKAGTVTIVFPGRSPFRTDDAVMTSVTSNDTPTIEYKGEKTIFACHCFVVLSDGRVVGWGPAHPRSGGDHHVGH
jgi:hypothetical protein